jgi:hypothetical protein
LAIIIVLVISAFSPLTVYADEGTPAETSAAETSGEAETSTEGAVDAQATKEAPQTEGEGEASSDEAVDAQPTEKAPPVEGEASVEQAVDDSTAAADGEALTETGAVDEAAPAEGEADSEKAPLASDAAILSEVPEDTAVTVLNENGEAQPLATQEAAEAISVSDPIWCPGAQAPTPGTNGCTPNFNSFTELLTFLSGNPDYQGAGTIYVQQGAYQGNDPNHEINFNSPNYDLSHINNSNLAITGGWNPSDNSISSTSPTTFNNYSIIIGSNSNPWGGSLTIVNIEVTDALNGIELHATDSVNINQSRFDSNRRTGAIIRAGQDVSIANSSFSNGTTARSQRVGLDIVNGGSTSLFNVIANNNRFSGVNINSTGDVIIGSSDFSHTKHAELNGVSFYDTRLLVNASGAVYSGYGLLVITPGTISLDNVTANDNFLWGASLDAGSNIAISNSVFNMNTTAVPGFIDDTGLIITGGADVALNNVTADDNRLYGAVIDAAGTVSISDSNFNNNRGVITTDGVTTLHGHGLRIHSLASIFIDNTNATNNMLFGGELNAAGEVAVSNSNFSNTSTDPGQEAVGVGLGIVSAGNASLANVVLNQNQTDGADIQAGGTVFLDLVSATNNGMDGVAVQTSCTHLSGGDYSGNGQYGLNLGSSALDLVSPATMFNNGAGNIFPATPPVCNFATSGGGGVTPGTGSSGVGGTTPQGSTEYPNLFVGYFNATTTGPDTATVTMSLNEFLAQNTKGIADYIETEPFTGRFVYVHSDDGQIYVVALLLEG